MKQRVLLGLSGGVDSAVTALLLKKQGYEVVGAFIRCFSEEKNKVTGECSWIEDKKEAQKISALLNIKLIDLNYEKEYAKNVIKPMFKDYAKGKTPNPDSLCNKTIKFPYLWEEAKKHKCNFIATGHYIKKILRPYNFLDVQSGRKHFGIKKIRKGNKYYLKIPKDKSKDQSYFLYQLTQKDLEHTLFPIGDYTKTQIRKIAKQNNLPNWNRQGTRGLCFVGNINMKECLKQKIKNKPGIIKNPEGKPIGKHNGIMFYTIGERLGENKEITINQEYRDKTNSKLYVSSKNIKKNELIVAPKNHQALLKNKFKLKNINWITKKPNLNKELYVRIRHLGNLTKAKIAKKGNQIICTLKTPTKGLAQGQTAIIYTKQGIILGGGEITY